MNLKFANEKYISFKITLEEIHIYIVIVEDIDMPPNTRRSQKAKRAPKDKAQFDFKGFHKLQTKGKLKYGDLNELYVARVDTKNVGYTDLLNFVRSKQKDIKQFYPTAYMNI